MAGKTRNSLQLLRKSSSWESLILEICRDPPQNGKKTKKKREKKYRAKTLKLLLVLLLERVERLMLLKLFRCLNWESKFAFLGDVFLTSDSVTSDKSDDFNRGFFCEMVLSMP